jgi:glycolate oxidase FAD binding subunit
VELGLSGLARVVDYTPRDMTIVVEAGARMADLTTTLAAEGQHLPIDAPRAGEATIGGVVATNWGGPRRYGYGTIRDYVIGIHAVDGRGVAFKGGGRVVKNVAGYDFCKLLTGSLGTLGVITQLALKVKPRPETAATIVATSRDSAATETILDRLAGMAVPPVAIDVLIGRAWRLEDDLRDRFAGIVVRVEGTEQEVDWLAADVGDSLDDAGAKSVRRLDEQQSAALWHQQREFSDRGAGDGVDESPLVAKIVAPPSDVTRVLQELLAFDPECAIQAHAGNGIVYGRFGRFEHADVTRVLIGKLRPLAVERGGSLVVLSSRLEGLTPHVVWGGRTEAILLMERIKRKFDPHNILNPRRFVF